VTSGLWQLLADVANIWLDIIAIVVIALVIAGIRWVIW
jgi:hypothetical protein